MKLIERDVEAASLKTQEIQAQLTAVRFATNRSRTLRSPSTSAVEDPRSAPFHLCQSGTHPGDAMLVEGLRMAQLDDANENHNQATFSHRPVMLDEIVELFAPVRAGVLIDATLGGAGHTLALLQAHPQLKVLGIDRDDVAIEAASMKLTEYISGGRAKVHKARFDAMASAVEEEFPGEPVVGVLLDLGVSSPQLDVADRGFSYKFDGPLDMRMDRTQTLSAYTVVNEYDLTRLIDVLREGGEDQFAKRIARAIVEARPLQTTGELAEVIRNAIPAPARRRPGDPSKRSFQAVRMEVNAETSSLENALAAALDITAPGGRIVVLAYHSGEDRIVKSAFAYAETGGCTCPPQLPCVCGAVKTARLLNRGSKKPSQQEISVNSRAQSARLRAVEMLDRPQYQDRSDRGMEP